MSPSLPPVRATPAGTDDNGKVRIGYMSPSLPAAPGTDKRPTDDAARSASAIRARACRRYGRAPAAWHDNGKVRDREHEPEPLGSWADPPQSRCEPGAVLPPGHLAGRNNIGIGHEHFICGRIMAASDVASGREVRNGARISAATSPLVTFFRLIPRCPRAAARRPVGRRLDADARLSLLRGDDAPRRPSAGTSFRP